MHLRFVWIPLLGAVLLSLPAGAQAGEPPEPSPDVRRWIEDLADAGEAGEKAVAKLKDAGPGAIDPLEKAASEREKDLVRRRRAAALLDYIETGGTPYEREMHFLLTQASWELPKGAPPVLEGAREEAKKKLGEQPDPVIGVLLSTYPENDHRRYQVARDLLKARGTSVVPAAANLLDHSAFLARLRAVHLLALIGGDEALEALSRASGDENDYVRKRVLEAWVEAGGEWASRVETFLDDEDASIRVVAVRRFETPDLDAGKIRARLDDDSFLVRKATAETLAAGGRAGFGALVERIAKRKTTPGRLEAIRALGLVARPDAENLRRNLEDREAWGRRVQDAVTLCTRLLGESDWACRASAAEALGLSGRTEPLEPFLAGETHPFVRFRIREALGEGLSPEPPDPSLFKEGEEPFTEKGLDRLAWLPCDERALTDALKALKLSRADLEFDRNLTDRDAYRFPVVQKALDEPLACAGIARRSVERIGKAARERPADLPGLLPSIAGLSYGTRRRSGRKAFPGAKEALAALEASDLEEGIAAPLRAFLDDSPWAEAFGQALEKVKPEDRRKILSHVSKLGWDPDLLEIWDKVDGEALAVSWDLFVRSAWALSQALSDLPEAQGGRGVLFETQTPLGRIVVAGSGPDRHEGPHLLLVDLGGDDAYAGAACAGARGDEEREAFSLVIDLSGNDRYVSRAPVAQGAGFLGMGILLDLAGDDRYEAEANAQGCGWFGGGFLYDVSGDDRYACDQVCQGAGGFGTGSLLDGGGDDVYYARAYAQGFGFTGGVGCLAEAGGNDLYYTDGKYLQYESLPHRKLSMCQGVGFGMRPHASGGIGILWEGGGDDVYRANAYGQGTSYWYSLGMLVDEEGYDNYSAKIYSQASGIHMGVGVLADLDGFDNYLSWGLSQSGSHDLGVSYFLDAAGEDIYTCHDASLGGAINHAVAIFVDRAGRDAYFMKNRGAVGAGDWRPRRRDWHSIGIFLDLGGAEDTYPAQKGGNGRFWADGELGVGIDR